MNINELCDIAEHNPDEFVNAASKFREDSINRICSGDEKCIWRMSGDYYRLEKEADKIINPTARLNFIIARFWAHVNTHY